MAVLHSILRNIHAIHNASSNPTSMHYDGRAQDPWTKYETQIEHDCTVNAQGATL